tara:strand:- start:456 stop:1427 length:972 start_codon:yes stop_codon:yes gene_type:complete
MLKVFIRCDSSKSLGFGHLMRCLAIAKNMRELYSVTFVTNIESEELIKKEGFCSLLISEKEEEEVLHIATNNANSIWIIDSKKNYSENFFSSLKLKARMLLLIENVSQFSGIADAILFPCAHLDEKLTKPVLEKYPKVEILSGWEWVLIRDEIRSGLNKKIKKESLVVTTGGSDPEGVFLVLFELFKKIKFKATFLVGENFSNKFQIPKSTKNINVLPYDHNEIHKANYVISTFGVSIYESIFLSKPTFSVAHSNENAQGSKILSSLTNLCIDVGFYKEINQETLKNTLLTKIDFFRANEMSKPKAFDGLGSERLVKWINSKL